MSFVTVGYLVFFLVVFVIYWRLGRRAQSYFLLIASYFFYAQWDWRFLSLIVISTIVDYYAGLGIHKAEKTTPRKLWLLFSLATNLGILGYFKYFNFFADSLLDLGASVGFHVSWTTTHIILPVGISFYTFQTLSYTIDIYRGKLKPTRSIVDFGAFVAFFPQLVAGPIVRAREFLYQLEAKRTFSPSEFESGAKRFVLGYFKKAFIADYLAIHLVDPVFADPTAYASGTLWLGLLGYTAQIYCDFSGYSSMAIGSARMLGFHIPENFTFPYLATSMSDFWRRWHMTMSRFFRDYVYIGLGGNRSGFARTVRNLAATTLISGLWHGANWTFVVWGGLHGLFIATAQVWRRIRGGGETPQRPPGMVSRITGWILVQSAAWFAWIVFRSPDFTTARFYIEGMWKSPGTGQIEVTFLLIVAFAATICDHVYGWISERPLEQQPGLPAPAVATFFVLLIVFMYHAIPSGANPFIYFQF